VNWAAAALILGMTTSVSVAGEPQVLSDLELESITAAGVLVDVNSIAAAFGDSTRALTDAHTSVLDGKNFDVGFGFTTGQALACCGEEADVDVGSAVFGAGDIVYYGTRAFKADGGGGAAGLSAGLVVAVSFTDPTKMIRELNSTLLSADPPLAPQ
jgi:hypothetical protein